MKSDMNKRAETCSELQFNFVSKSKNKYSKEVLNNPGSFSVWEKYLAECFLVWEYNLWSYKIIGLLF